MPRASRNVEKSSELLANEEQLNNKEVFKDVKGTRTIGGKEVNSAKTKENYAWQIQQPGLSTFTISC